MKFVSIALALAAGALCFGADNGNSGRSSRNGGRGGFGGGMQRNGENFQRGGGNYQRGGMMRGSQLMVEAEIAGKYPAEFAEVEAMREKYEAALNALADKAGVKIPESMDSKMRKLRKNHPAEFNAAMEKMKTSPQEGMKAVLELAKKDGVELMGARGGFAGRNGRGGENGGFGGGRPQAPDVSRSFDRPDMQSLRRKYPEDMRKYDEMRGKNPAEARKILLEIIEKDKKSGK